VTIIVTEEAVANLDKTKEISKIESSRTQKAIFFHRSAKFSCGRGRNAVSLPRHLRRILIQVSRRMPV
jgi:hypothetical protein